MNFSSNPFCQLSRAFSQLFAGKTMTTADLSIPVWCHAA